MSKLARALQQAGLIERAEHPDDSRAVQLTLTDRGREVTAQATERVRGLQDELTGPLGGLDSPATQALISLAPHAAGIRPPASTDRASTDRRRPMTGTATPTLNGQDIGQAESAVRAVLTGLLARTGTPFHGWVILNLLGRSDGGLGEDELTGQARARPQDRRGRGARGGGRTRLAGADQP